MINRGSPRTRSRAVVVGHLLTLAAFVVIYLAFRVGVLVVAAALPIATILIGIRLNRITDRLPWLLLLAGLAMLTVVNLDTFVRVHILNQDDQGTALFNELFQMAGYLALLASGVVVVMRHAPQDAGGVIDAALLGVGGTAPLWVFVLRPRMLAAGAGTLSQTVLLVELLVLLAIIGSLLRISRTASRARGAVTYMFVALLATLTGLVLTAVVPQPTSAFHSALINICWLIGYLTLAAAPLHPSAGSLTEASHWRRDELSAVRLTQLGAVLLLIPIVGGVPQLFGQPPDGLLLSLGPLLTVPLVLTRIGQLVAQRSQDQHLLAYQASHDELTGLPNRRRLFALAGAAAGRLRDGKLGHLAVLYCDLDGFKPINDQFGHDAGDHVLRVVGHRLVASLRETDTVGRIGGDEFLALCPDADPDEAATLRRRVEEAVARPVPWLGHEIHVSVTVGMAVSSPRGPDTAAAPPSADALITAADQDMYARKRQRGAATVPGPRSAELDGVAHTMRS